MKPFTEYLAANNRVYEFVIRLAGCDKLPDPRSAIKSAMDIYAAEEVKQARRLPIQEHRDFVGLGACEVHVYELRLRYPTIPPQIRQIVAEKLNVPLNQVVVRTKLEEAEFDYTPVEPKKAKDGSVLSNPELESSSGQHLAGKQRVDSMLKDLQSRKTQFAATEKPAADPNMPTNNLSPVGSKQNKIPSPRGK